MDQKPKTRWLRFSVRFGFLLLAVLAIYLAYYVEWRRQRAAALSNTAVVRSSTISDANNTPFPLPIGLRLVQAQPYFYVHTTEDCDATERSRLQSLFPEAMVLNIFPDDEPLTYPPDWDRLSARKLM